jgi:hypothetical protein
MDSAVQEGAPVIELTNKYKDKYVLTFFYLAG